MQKHCGGDGSDMSWEWHTIESLKLPFTRHHQVSEKEAGQEQHGGGTIASELEEMGFSMGQAQYITKDRGRWRQIVDALCPIGDEEDKYASNSMMNDVLDKAYTLAL